MYPHIRWEYRYGYRIDNVSAYYADYYIGDIKTVYGKVKEVFYSYDSDEFFLHIGDYYPYHDFTIVMPGNIARNITRRPIAYFTNQYINVTGLITEFEGKPEIVVKRRFQLDVY
jgi:DNA/RNA endonuclease YhcR with UshA esterase domain